ncbi:MAG: hypothetical protein CL432_08755 [Acidimicrobiaceae bacterium]|nr:hypothetical protein [Acidimicrobiaceae bacterium]
MNPKDSLQFTYFLDYFLLMNREIADHNLAISAGQQLGLSSRGYRGVRLAGQEGRVQRFHDVLGEYLDGFRP